jgi:hypothetical protein
VLDRPLKCIGGIDDILVEAILQNPDPSTQEVEKGLMTGFCNTGGSEQRGKCARDPCQSLWDDSLLSRLFGVDGLPTPNSGGIPFPLTFLSILYVKTK